MDTKGNQTTKLNPFALPLETDVLFMLLIVAGILLVFGLSVVIATPYLAVTNTILEDYADTVIYALEGNIASEQTTEVIKNFQQAYERSFPIFAVATISPLGLPILLLVVAYSFYYQTSTRLIKKKNLSRLKRTTDSKLYDLVNHLSVEVGLDVPPIAHINNENMSANSQVWTDNKRYYISFGMGSRTLLRKKASYLKAIILHELAHIVNKDVAYTYFVQSLWRVIAWITGLMLLIALSLYLYYSMNPQQLSAFLPAAPTQSQSELIFEYLQGEGLSWLKFAATGSAIVLIVIPTFSLSIIIILIRAKLLRLRELYADCRAVSWGAAHEFKTLFGRQRGQKKSFLQKLLTLHPTVEMRQAYLEDPSLFFRFSYMTSIMTGFLISLIIFMAIIILFIYNQVTLTLSDLIRAFDILKNSSNLAVGSFLDGKGLFPFAYSIHSFLVFFLPILFLLFIAFMITEVGGIAVQRGLVLSEISGRKPWQTSWDLGIYAGSFAIGACMGIVLLSLPLGLLIGWSFKVMVGLLLIVFLMFTGLIWVVLEYIYRFSRLSFRRYQGYLSPRRIGKSIRTSALLLILIMLMGIFIPPIAAIIKGAIDVLVFVYSGPYRDVIFDFVRSAQKTLIEEPTISLTKLPNALPPDLINSFLKFFPSLGELILSTAFCFAVVTILFFVLTRKMLQPDIQLVMQCPQCQTKLTNTSRFEQTCPNCGLTSGWWTVPEDIADRKHLLGLFYLEQAYALNGRNRNKQALSAAQRAMEYVRHKSEVFNLLGIIYQKMGKREEAKQAFSQALALYPDYEPAKQNLGNVATLPPAGPKRSVLRRLWNVSAKTTPKTDQNKKQQVELVLFLIISSLCSLIFPSLYAVIWPLISGLGMIAIVYAAVSYLLDDRLSDYARPGNIVINLLIVQLIRLMIAIWLAGSLFTPFLDFLVVLISIAVILWLIFLPDISAYLASIVATTSLFLYQMAFLVISFRFLPAFSLNWMLDLVLTVAIVYFSLVCHTQYSLKVANRQQIELPTMID